MPYDWAKHEQPGKAVVEPKEDPSWKERFQSCPHCGSSIDLPRNFLERLDTLMWSLLRIVPWPSLIEAVYEHAGRWIPHPRIPLEPLMPSRIDEEAIRLRKALLNTRSK